MKSQKYSTDKDDRDLGLKIPSRKRLRGFVVSNVTMKTTWRTEKQVRGKNFVYLETDEYWLRKCDFFSLGQLISLGLITKSTKMERSINFCCYGRDRPGKSTVPKCH